MRVTVTAICENQVYVNTDIGIIYGVWCSNEPVELKEYELELDCDEIITSDKISFSNSPQPFVSSCGGMVILNGIVEDIQEKVLFLRLSQDIVMLEVSSNFDITAYLHKFVRIYLSKLNLYDIGLL